MNDSNLFLKGRLSITEIQKAAILTVVMGGDVASPYSRTSETTKSSSSRSKLPSWGISPLRSQSLCWKSSRK